MIRHAFFVFSQLLLDFADRQVQCSDHAGGFCGRDKVLRVLRRNVDFYGWLVQMLQIDCHFDRVDSIEQPPQFFDLFDNDGLILRFEVAMTSGYVDLHG